MTITLSNFSDSLLVFATILPIVFNIFFVNIIKAKCDFKSDWQQFFMEYILIIVPVIFYVTILNDYIIYIIIAGITVMTLWIFSSGILTQKCLKICLEKRHQYITYSRSVIYILTSVCILAVDFKIFPKEFYKSEEFGCTLMDTGIGFFIFSMGIVSNNQHFLHNLKTVGLLLILGFLRSYVIYLIGYHQEITEYGLYWNAFFTLAFTNLISVILISTFPRKKLLLAITIGILNEFCLKFYFEEFVMNPFMQRDTVFKANREGILSLPGCIILYLLSCCYHDIINLRNKNTITVNDLLRKNRNLLVIGGISFLMFTFYVIEYKVSRRIANAGYVLWIIWMGVMMVALFMIIEILSRQYYLMQKKTFTPIKLLECINSNTLIYFLLSNLLTGIVNIFFQPDNKTHMQSILILIIYTFVVNLCTYFLKKILIKK